MRDFTDYSFQGLTALGEAVRHWREADKPHWHPVVPVSAERLKAERGRWSLDMAAEIINREFGLPGETAISRDAIHKLELPRLTFKEPSNRLIELIAGLNIMLNPATGLPYSAEDLRAIARLQLDWQTGKPIKRLNNSHR